MEQLGGRTLHNNPLISIVFHKKNDTLTSQLFFAGLARLHVSCTLRCALWVYQKKCGTLWNTVEKKTPFSGTVAPKSPASGTKPCAVGWNTGQNPVSACPRQFFPNCHADCPKLFTQKVSEKTSQKVFTFSGIPRARRSGNSPAAR